MPLSRVLQVRTVAREVRHELVMLPYYGVFDELAFRVDGGTVTLMGAVTRPTLKSDAENVRKHVEGVIRVIDNIEVLPVSPMDDQVTHVEPKQIIAQQPSSSSSVQGNARKASPWGHAMCQNCARASRGLRCFKILGRSPKW